MRRKTYTRSIQRRHFVDIEWYGLSCFKIKEGNFTLITDPYDRSIGYTLPKNLRADVVTISHEAPGHAAADQVKAGKLLKRPGEYEVKGVFITGIQSWLGSGVKGEAKAENTIFVFEFGDLTVCHLGDLSRGLTQAQVESMPDVHVLLVPVGGGGALDADKAAQVISQLEPRYVIPMHYQTQYGIEKLDPLTKFLKEMGVAEHQALDSVRITKANLPEESQVVVLECRQGA
jgi:L-ascorbate metabolism protein UlaG (beta-lactamase superfamily)